MCKSIAIALAGIVLMIAVLYQPFISPVMKDLGKAPKDLGMGVLSILSTDQLKAIYQDKRVLIVGGTRGVGRGTALAVAAAGAYVTLVGRSQPTELLIRELAQNAGTSEKISFLAGDLGSAASAKKLVDSLAQNAHNNGRFDFLVVTAAVFPKWGDLFQEDGLERGFAIAAMGRYLLYREAGRYLSASPRILNVLASGTIPSPFNRSLATGEVAVENLIQAIMMWSTANEIMQIQLQDKMMQGTTRVTTHPGLLGTDLHRGQGWLFDVFEAIVVGFMGISEEDCGLRQASILASHKLHFGQLSYVDQDMQGRIRSPELQKEADEHGEWLLAFLEKKLGGAN